MKNNHRGPLQSRRSKRTKKESVANQKTRLTTGAQSAVLRFTEYHPVPRFSRNLRTLLLEFLMFEGATEVSYLPDLLYDLQGLFELFEVLCPPADE
jgi:hypothetical protein